VELGPDAVGSTLLGPGPASFWRRRQLHETLVHLWDVRTPAGLGVDVAPEVWADTVDEVVTVMQPRQVRMGRMEPLPAPIALVATDVRAAWRTASVHDDHDKAAVEVRGPASDLALMLWGRRAPDDVPSLVVDGDRAVLDDALGRRLTP
jgi:uncharacterized protein (TIGR03083 family)